MKKKIRESQCFPENGRNAEREKSRLEWGGGYNFVPLCRVHNWFDGGKGYWYRYLYVSRGWRWNERPCTVCFEVCFFLQGAALCLYSRAAVKGTVQKDEKRLKSGVDGWV
jgi:hypothetical protein